MQYAAQLDAKQRIITDAMVRIGKREITPPEVVASADDWRYRTKLTLAMRRRSGGWIAGLHPYDDPGRVFALEDCPITDRRVVAAWRELMRASEFLPDATSLRGSVRWTDEGPTFVLIGATRWSDHARFFDAVPTLAALYWEAEDAPRKLLGDRRVHATPAASFAQVNPVVAAVLREYVLGVVRSFHPMSVIDAYSGAGDLAVNLATTGMSVVAIELDRDAAVWAEKRLAPPSRSIVGRVEDVLPRLAPADVVVVNPPRSGLHANVTEALAEMPNVRAIIYVSCDPATLARDAARLSGYAIQSIRAFDMFPQTSHVETVCVLTPAHSEATEAP
jgi:23S rRNA (uracil1939-C5)-methyltransferase